MIKRNDKTYDVQLQTGKVINRKQGRRTTFKTTICRKDSSTLARAEAYKY